jgi:hypothetical protein
VALICPRLKANKVPQPPTPNWLGSTLMRTDIFLDPPLAAEGGYDYYQEYGKKHPRGKKTG